MTGISTHALRAWERRYDGFAPSRSEAGGRLYSDEDVARLRLIRQLLDRGHAIGELSSLSTQELHARLGTHGDFGETATGRAAPPSEVAQKFVEAIAVLDVAAADQALSRAAISFEPRQLVLEVVTPAIEELCVRHERSELRTVHANLATSLFQGFLTNLHRLYVRPSETPGVFCVTPVHEPHEFGALLGAFVAVMHGHRALYLGSQLTVADMLEVVTRTDCPSLLLSIVSEHNPKLGAELVRLAVELPSHCEVLLTGRGASRYHAFVPQARVLPDATSLQQHFEQADAHDLAAHATLAKVKCSL